MIKIDAHEIKHQLKNKHLFETIIPIKQKQSIMQFVFQPIQY
jgi:hypothetical protein